MKAIILLIVLYSVCFGQDRTDGKIHGTSTGLNDYSGSGLVQQAPLSEIIQRNHYRLQVPPQMHPETVSYSQFWSSPSGAFTNCWDGSAGYFDNDTLLDIAGYTFSPGMFYIWEQSSTVPDSFALVYSYTKTESGGFGPLAVGDVDSDGKTDFVLSDFSTLSRIYIISNTGNNTYVSRETQNTITHPADGSSAQSIVIGDLNKNGQKEIICMRGSSSPSSGMVRIWEHTGGPGSFAFTNLYTYTTVSYLFGKGGIGDSNGDGWDEVYLTYGGYDVFNINIRKIHYDSVSATFQHEIFTAPAIGFPSFYKVADVNNDGIRELIATGSSNNKAAIYVFKSNGPNSYQAIDSIFEPSDPNTMMISDIKVLTGDVYPTILGASFSGNVYMYKYDGSHYPQIYHNLSYPGSAIRRVYWLPWTGYDGYFNTWSSTSSNGTFYLFKKDALIGITNNQTPVAFSLSQNYPNPFNPATVISYQLIVNSKVRLCAYDTEGRLVSVLVDGRQSAGKHSISFKADNLASGVYFYSLIADGQVLIKKMVLLK